MLTTPSNIFICGTDTGVGKTTVVALMLALMREAGLPAAPMKPVATGCARRRGTLVADDLERCLRVAGMQVGAAEIAVMAPYRLALPASPHLAARHEQRRIAVPAIRRALARLTCRYRPVLIEGAGGLMVPLQGRFLTLDLIATLGAPVVLVARSGLGTINHCLLTLNVLRTHRLPVAGIVFNDGPDDDPRVSADNMRCIPRLGRTRFLGRIPFHHDIDGLFKRAAHDPAVLETLTPGRRQWIQRILRYANQASAGMVSPR